MTAFEPPPSGGGARERLLAHGAEALSDVEILALLLHTGTRGAGVEALGRQLLSRFGLRALGDASAAELCAVPGVGTAKAATLLAAFELGRRMAGRRLKRGDPIRCPADVYHHFHPRLRCTPQEQFHVLLLDGRHRIMREVLISRGTLTASLVHPREVFRMALRESAAALVLVHNHPSGDPTPSAEDRNVTQRLRRAGALLGVPVMDHIVVAEHGFVSLHEEGDFDKEPT